MSMSPGLYCGQLREWMGRDRVRSVLAAVAAAAAATAAVLSPSRVDETLSGSDIKPELYRYLQLTMYDSNINISR